MDFGIKKDKRKGGKKSNGRKKQSGNRGIQGIEGLFR